MFLPHRAITNWKNGGGVAGKCVVRPTGLLDPLTRSAHRLNQIDDLLDEIDKSG